MKNKRIMSAAMAVMMAGSLAACGGSGASTPAASGAASTSTAASAAAAGEDKFASLGDFLILRCKTLFELSDCLCQYAVLVARIL